MCAVGDVAEDGATLTAAAVRAGLTGVKSASTKQKLTW
jgi:hypothetical protein